MAEEITFYVEDITHETEEGKEEAVVDEQELSAQLYTANPLVYRDGSHLPPPRGGSAFLSVRFASFLSSSLFHFSFQVSSSTLLMFGGANREKEHFNDVWLFNPG